MKKELKCLICSNFYNHLGSHVWHKHKILAREYKEKFELPYNTALISKEIKEKKQIKFELNREKYIKNLNKYGKKYWFKKGKTGQRRISQKERETNLERIMNVNKRHSQKLEKCPVCKIQYRHVESHLANKHKLLKIKKQ